MTTKLKVQTPFDSGETEPHFSRDPYLALRDGRGIACALGSLFGNAELCDVFRAVCQEETYWRSEHVQRVWAPARQALRLIRRGGPEIRIFTRPKRMRISQKDAIQ